MEAGGRFETTWINSKIYGRAMELRRRFVVFAFIHFITIKKLSTIFAFHILK
jgi:hypothetical protein